MVERRSPKPDVVGSSPTERDFSKMIYYNVNKFFYKKTYLHYLYDCYRYLSRKDKLFLKKRNLLTINLTDLHVDIEDMQLQTIPLE